MFHRLLDSAWADGSLAELVGELGNMMEQPDQSQPRYATTRVTLYLAEEILCLRQVGWVGGPHLLIHSLESVVEVDSLVEKKCQAFNPE